MRNVYGCWHLYALEVLCEVLQAIREDPASCFQLLLSSASSLLREFAGLNKVDESYGSDVEEELVLELDDSPRLCQMELLTTAPLTSETLRQVCSRGFAPS